MVRERVQRCRDTNNSWFGTVAPFRPYPSKQNKTKMRQQSVDLNRVQKTVKISMPKGVWISPCLSTLYSFQSWLSLMTFRNAERMYEKLWIVSKSLHTINWRGDRFYSDLFCFFVCFYLVVIAVFLPTRKWWSLLCCNDDQKTNREKKKIGATARPREMTFLRPIKYGSRRVLVRCDVGLRL